MTSYEYRVDGGAWIGAATTTVDIRANLAHVVVEVRALNSVGPSGIGSADGSPEAPRVPEKPTVRVSGMTAEGVISFNWDTPVSPGSDILRYEYRWFRESTGAPGDWKSATADEFAARAASVQVTGLTEAGPFMVEVRAINEVGAGASGAARQQYTPPTDPGAGGGG